MVNEPTIFAEFNLIMFIYVKIMHETKKIPAET